MIADLAKCLEVADRQRRIEGYTGGKPQLIALCGYGDDRRFGFIEAGDIEVFFRTDAISDLANGDPEPGQRVRFKIKERQDGRFHAIRVTRIGG